MARRTPHHHTGGPPGDVGDRDKAVGREASAVIVERLPSEAQVPSEAGEPAFAAPWELRAFAIGVALTLEGRLDWNQFQAALIDEIAGWETQSEPKSSWSYYRRWLAALERVASHNELIERNRLDSRTSAILAMSKHAH